MAATLVGLFLVYRVGRRFLLLAGAEFSSFIAPFSMIFSVDTTACCVTVSCELPGCPPHKASTCNACSWYVWSCMDSVAAQTVYLELRDPSALM